jgi:hypothetical protein
MRVNTTQRIIILAGLAVVVLTGLYPPWTHTLKRNGTSWERPADYCFIARPPIEQDTSVLGLKIDMSRLLIQCAVAMTATGFGVLLTAKREDKPKG